MFAFVTKFVWLIPFFPLVGFLLNGLPTAVGVKLGKKYVNFVACGAMLAAFAVAVCTFLYLKAQPVEGRTFTVHLWPWIHAGALKADIAYLIDPLSSLMMLIITGIGFLIHVYSIGYMHEEPSYARFFTYLNLFCFMMLQLVMGNNLFLLFVGWEGVGLCSYLLIGFWFKEKLNGAAGMKAFLVNRVGDFGMMIGMMALYWALYKAGKPTIAFMELKDAVASLNGMTILGMSAATFICIFLFVGATGKSAQLPLYVWLPDAMAGPTPVSALIHAATMVTAGVYMIARMNWLFTMSPVALTVIASVGALTALFAATIGFAQNDIKKVLAYSTVSQLGYMFLAMGTGAYVAGVFHLMTHAFFKACLFLGSGSVIMGMHHEQDMRLMGGLRKSMPITFWTFMLATIAIAGVFPFAGFFSKDEILWLAFVKGTHGQPWYLVLYVVGLCGALGTSFYMMRCVTMTFFGELRANNEALQHDVQHDKALAVEAQVAMFAKLPVPVSPASDDSHGHDHAHADHNHAHHDAGHDAHDDHGHGHHAPLVPHESPVTMTFALVVLAALSVLGGFLNVPQSLGGSSSLNQWLSPVIPYHPHHETNPVEYLLMVLSVGLALSFMMLGFKSYTVWTDKVRSFVARFPGLYRAALNKYFVDEGYFSVFVAGLLRINTFFAAFDRLVIDGIVNLVGKAGVAYSNVSGWVDKTFVDGAVNGAGWSVAIAGRSMRKFQTGKIQHYAYGALFGIVVALVIKIML
jgi:NADH-quinone oxidoreductase subunit L